MRLKSGYFENHDFLPGRYTCDGGEGNPPLTIEDAPAEVKSFVLLLRDKDAGTGPAYHWALYNIPPAVRRIPADGRIGISAVNDFERHGYSPPCPHRGIHRYCFSLHALDKVLNLGSGKGSRDVMKAMEGHCLATAEMVVWYERKNERDARLAGAEMQGTGL